MPMRVKTHKTAPESVCLSDNKRTSHLSPSLLAPSLFPFVFGEKNDLHKKKKQSINIIPIVKTKFQTATSEKDPHIIDR